MRDEGWQTVEDTQHEKLLEEHQNAPVQTPEEEVPGSAVPDAGEPPHDHDVEDVPWRLDAIAAEGDIDVIAKETTKRHMPTSPKFRGAFRRVGIIEVSRIIESHHLAQTDCHVRIAREVEVDLEGVGCHAREAADEANLRGIARQKGVGENACRVSKQHLLTEPDAE